MIRKSSLHFCSLQSFISRVFVLFRCFFYCFFSNFVEYKRREMCLLLTFNMFLKSWFLMISSEVIFQRNVVSEKEDTVFHRGAVIIYAYQAVLSRKAKIKLDFFHHFPQPPAFHPSGAFRLRQIV